MPEPQLPKFGGKAGKRSPKRESTPRSFPAMFHGECPSCWDRIEPGDMVGYNRDNEVVHEECL